MTIQNKLMVQFMHGGYLYLRENAHNWYYAQDGSWIYMNFPETLEIEGIYQECLK